MCKYTPSKIRVVWRYVAERICNHPCTTPGNAFDLSINWVPKKRLKKRHKIPRRGEGDDLILTRACTRVLYRGYPVAENRSALADDMDCQPTPAEQRAANLEERGFWQKRILAKVRPRIE
eukprot:COSAG03_NODE_13434_length_503_cov_1.143564_1_plen_120_part_00